MPWSSVTQAAGPREEALRMEGLHRLHCCAEDVAGATVGEKDDQAHLALRGDAGRQLDLNGLLAEWAFDSADFGQGADDSDMSQAAALVFSVLDGGLVGVIGEDGDEGSCWGFDG